MTAHRVCPDPACAELADRDALRCPVCFKPLVPDFERAERYQRVRAAIVHTSASVDADEHAALVVSEVEKALAQSRHPSRLTKGGVATSLALREAAGTGTDGSGSR